MLTKKFEFDIGQKVKIEAINIEGRITALFVAQNGPEYRVRYFDNCESREIYFYADEIKLI